MAPRTLEEILASLEEITGQLTQSANAPDDPLNAVAVAFASRARAEKLLADRIAEARAANCSWAAIGAMLGTSGEAARQRYGHRR
jgi:hypothetical protein